MISSRIFTAMLRYNIDNENFDIACEQLKEKVNEMFEDEHFTKLANIITAEYSIKVDKKKNPEVDIVVIIYATVDSTIESNKGFAKLMEAYIDTYCEHLEVGNDTATLIKRKVI